MANYVNKVNSDGNIYYIADIEARERIDAIDTTLETKVDKVTGKGLSTNDLTNELKAKYDAAVDYANADHARTDATKTEASTVNGNIIIDGTETTVYTHPEGTNPHGTTKADLGLENVGNFKAVSTEENQGLSHIEKENARANIGAGTSSFTGQYDDLTGKPEALPASDVYPWAKEENKPSYTAAEVGLGNVGNFKAVSVEAGQGLSDSEKVHARENINAQVAGDYANAEHTHTVSEITDFPDLGTASAKNVAASGNASATEVVMGNDSRLTDARKASDVYDWAKAAVKPAYTAAEVGLGKVDNTADADKNVKYATTAGNAGSLGGETSDVWDTKIDAKVPTSRTINGKILTSNITLTPSDIGADAAGSAAAVQRDLDDAKAILDEHVENADIHFTAAERTKLAGIAAGSNKYEHPASGVTAGTYKSVTVDANGHITAGTNPTTLAGYGITDADAKGTAASAVSTHNSSSTAHSDIRNLIDGLTTRLNALADSDDKTLDQMSEIVAYIKSNKELIDSITTTKVNVADIVNNLTTNSTNKPLSAAQGVAIKALIDALETEVGTKATTSALTAHTGDTTAHITSSEHTGLTDAISKKHSHSNKSILDNTTASFTTAMETKLGGIATGAQVNQNAFSNVTVGSTTIAADSVTDTLTLVAGSNVTITPDATNDKITIAATDTVYTHPSTHAASMITGLATVATSGKYSDLTGTPTYTLSSFGVTATADELNYVDGVTSNIQTQLNGKAASSHGTHVSYGTSASALGTSSAGSATTVSRSDHVHALPALTSCSGTLTLAKGGTGATTAAAARTNLGLANTITIAYADEDDNYNVTV